MSVTFVTSAEKPNAGGTDASIVVPTGVTTAHFGIITVATANQNMAAMTVPTGWTQRSDPASGSETGTLYIFTRLGGVAAGQTITLTLPVTSAATTTVAFYDTGGRDVAFASSVYNTGAQDVTTVTFPAPGHPATADVLLVMADRTDAANSLPAPSGTTRDYAYQDPTNFTGGWYAHANAVTSQVFTATWAPGGSTSHNVAAMQLALAGTNFTAGAADNVGLTDAVTATLVTSYADVLGITGTTTVVQSQTPSIAVNNVGITDTAAGGLGRITSAADTVGLTDAVTATRGVVAADAIGITDAEAIYGVFALPVVTTAEPDVEATTVSLNDVASLSGVAVVSTDVSLADLEVGPQRAIIDIEASTSDLTHVVALSGTAGVETGLARPNLRVVARLTDVLSRQVTGVVQTMSLGNGPIYADGTGVAATGGVEPGVYGPTRKPVWKLTRNLAVPAGWGSYIAAKVSDDIAAGATVTISIYARGPVGEDTTTQIVSPDGTDVLANTPPFPAWDDSGAEAGTAVVGSSIVAGLPWVHYIATFTLPRVWVAGVHEFRLSVYNWIEWSDATLTVTMPLQMHGPTKTPKPETEPTTPKKFNRVFAVLR